MSAHAILVTAFDRPGMMSALTTVLADHGANITHVDIHPGSPTTGIYFEVTIPDERAQSAINGDKVVRMGMNDPEASQNAQFVLNVVHWLSGLLPD